MKCTTLSLGIPNQVDDRSIPVLNLLKHNIPTAITYKMSRILDIVLILSISEYKFSEEFRSVEIRCRDFYRTPAEEMRMGALVSAFVEVRPDGCGKAVGVDAYEAERHAQTDAPAENPSCQIDRSFLQSGKPLYP